MDESSLSIILKLLLVVALIAANGMFTAAELSVVTVRRTRLEHLSSQGNFLASLVLKAIGNVNNYLATIQLGVTMASLGLGWVGEPFLADLIAPVIATFLSGVASTVVSHAIASALTFVLITGLLIIYGELMPKAVALWHAERLALMLIVPMIVFRVVSWPAIWTLDRLTALSLRLFRIQPPPGGLHAAHSVEELQALVEESVRAGVLKEEGELLEGIFDIRNRRVHEIMTPRPEIVWVAKGTTVSGLLSVFSEASHSRFPVYEGDHDNIAGFISVKDVLKALGEGRLTMDSPIDSLLRPGFFVPETKEVGKLFVEMQQEGHPMALVVDEYGGISGLVTIKMLLEEMVGPLGEEWAKPEKEFEAIDERTFEVDAGMTIYDANDELGLDIPEGQYETVAGFVLSQLGHIPEQGEQFVYDGWRLTVSEIKGVKIERVLLTRLEVATPDSAARRAS